MGAGSTRRWRTWLGIVAAALLICAWALGVALVPLTPERARTALAARFPELERAPVKVQGKTVFVGDYECDLGKRTWSHTSVEKLTSYEWVVWVTQGTFENPFFIHWSVSTESKLGWGGGIIVP
jgi:hypothetical protein